jgi:anti-sigma B factor antagonist
MAFKATLEIMGSVAKITLSGELDASVAPAFRADIEKAAEHRPQHLVLLMQDLKYIASAGLRVLIFAKQKMGAEVDIYAIAPQEQVRDTFEMTGFHHSIQILDGYDADKIEHV